MSINDIKTRLLLLATALLAPSTAGAASITKQTDIPSIEQVPRRIFSLLLIFLPAIATIYLAIAGYRYIVSQGNQDLMEKAKKNLTYAVVGVVVAYSSFVIIRLVGNQLGFGFTL